MFAGLDVIGDYLTEINVTSPTGIRELDRQFGIDIAAKLIAAIDAKLKAGRGKSARRPLSPSAKPIVYNCGSAVQV